MARKAEQDVTNPVWLDRPLPKEYAAALQKHDPPGRWSQPIEIDFAVLDAATMEYLAPPRIPGLVDIQREQRTTGSVRYVLHNNELGPIGAVTLRKIDEDLTEIAFTAPPQPKRRPITAADCPDMPMQSDPPSEATTAARADYMASIDKQREAERAAQYLWRRGLHSLVVTHFIARLEEERTWVASMVRSGGKASPADGQHLSWKHMEDYWLWLEVNVHGKRLKDVFEEWNARSAHRNLTNAREAAKKIVQKR